MILSKGTIELFETGKIKRAAIVYINENNEYCTFTCKVSKVIKYQGDIIIKLKTGKDYPLGHKYVFRSIEELI